MFSTLSNQFLSQVICLLSPTANERAVQATSKKVAVKQGLENVKKSLLLTGKSIKKVPYKFRKVHFSSQFRRPANQKIPKPQTS